MKNELGGETSPYLLQHRDNPVHWQPWREETFTQARVQGRPILLSIGYAACHWCHVMAHESFEDDEIAGLMNELFINIKVDREERPDIDTIYQSALAATGEHGGWPLTMFLTPEAAPFWGGTYFPPESRYGRPGFPDVLRGISQTYRDKPDDIAANADKLTSAVRSFQAPAESGARIDLNPETLNQIAERIVAEIDNTHGGFGQAPKFPQPYLFELLWRAWLRTGDLRYRTAVEHTLLRICQGGIYDHLGGGFSRYSVDAAWLVPHFEKMLYDNAQLIALLTLVWRTSPKPLYKQRIEETVSWLQREMIAEGGAFAASLDADSEGVEGKFYVWTPDEVRELLGPETELFSTAYDVRPGGNWEGNSILHRTGQLAALSDADEARLTAARATLLEARGARIRPGWDDKVLADWNGLMIAALADAAEVFDRPDWLATARTAFDFVVEKMSDGDRLLHSHRNGTSQHTGLLDDYTNMSLAALALHQAAPEPQLLAHAETWSETIQRHFHDPQNGGYFQTADDAGALLVRPRSINDNANPAGNAVQLSVLSKLWLLTGAPDYRARADALTDAFAADLVRNFMPMTSYLNAAESHMTPVQIAIIGDADDDLTASYLTIARAAPFAAYLLEVIAPDAVLPAHHPAAGKSAKDGRATAYICIGQSCSLPITDAETFRDTLPQIPGD
jgi:uncharacterized protein YyaL (SSP411 family)